MSRRYVHRPPERENQRFRDQRLRDDRTTELERRLAEQTRKHSDRPPEDATIAYGARCTWWDDKRNVGTKASGLPCCPRCGGVLFEAPASSFFGQALVEREKTDPGYTGFIMWLRGRCMPDHAKARALYNEAKAAS